MSGGAGHIFDMIARIRGNRSMRGKRGYFKIKEALITVAHREHINWKKATPEELKRVRQKVRQQRKSDLTREVIVLLVSSVLAVMIITVVIYFGMRWYG